MQVYQSGKFFGMPGDTETRHFTTLFVAKVEFWIFRWGVVVELCAWLLHDRIFVESCSDADCSFCLLKCFKFINKKNVLNRKQSSWSRARRSWVRIPVSAKDFFFMKSLTVKVYFYDNLVLEFVPYKSLICIIYWLSHEYMWQMYPILNKSFLSSCSHHQRRTSEKFGIDGDENCFQMSLVSVLVNKQTNKQTNKQMNKQTNKRTNKQTNKRTNEQTNKRTCEQTNEQTNKRTNEVEAFKWPLAQKLFGSNFVSFLDFPRKITLDNCSSGGDQEPEMDTLEVSISLC